MCEHFSLLGGRRVGWDRVSLCGLGWPWDWLSYHSSWVLGFQVSPPHLPLFEHFLNKKSNSKYNWRNHISYDFYTSVRKQERSVFLFYKASICSDWFNSFWQNNHHVCSVSAKCPKAWPKTFLLFLLLRQIPYHLVKKRERKKYLTATDVSVNPVFLDTSVMKTQTEFLFFTFKYSALLLLVYLFIFFTFSLNFRREKNGMFTSWSQIYSI
jgi:hypothetical protein